MSNLKTIISSTVWIVVAACLMLVMSACSQQTEANSSSESETAQVNDAEIVEPDNKINVESNVSKNSAQEQLYTLDEMLDISEKSHKSGGHQYFALKGDRFYPLDTVLCVDDDGYDVLAKNDDVSILTPYPAGSDYYSSDSEVMRHYRTIDEMNAALPVVSQGAAMLTTNPSDVCLVYPIVESLYRSRITSGWSFGIDEVEDVEIDGSESFALVLKEKGIRDLERICVSDRPCEMKLGYYEGTRFIEEVNEVDIPCWETSEIYHGSWGAFYPSFSSGQELEVEKTKDGYFSISLGDLPPGKYAVSYTSNSGGGLFAIEIR